MLAAALNPGVAEMKDMGSYSVVHYLLFHTKAHKESGDILCQQGVKWRGCEASLYWV